MKPSSLKGFGETSQSSPLSCDAVETYFECITTCSIDDGACITRCVEKLRETLD